MPFLVLLLLTIFVEPASEGVGMDDRCCIPAVLGPPSGGSASQCYVGCNNVLFPHCFQQASPGQMHHGTCETCERWQAQDCTTCDSRPNKRSVLEYECLLGHPCIYCDCNGNPVIGLECEWCPNGEFWDIDYVDCASALTVNCDNIQP